MRIWSDIAVAIPPLRTGIVLERLAVLAPVVVELRQGAGCEPRPVVVGARGQDHRGLAADDQTCRLRACDEGQFLREHVPGLQVGDDQHVRLPGDERRDAFGARGLHVDGVVHGERAVDHAPSDLTAIRHLGEGGRIERGGHVDVHGLDGRQHTHLRRLEAAGDGELDRVLHDVHLGGEVGRDVDRGVRDEEEIALRRHVHDEHMADAARCPKAAFLLDHLREQLVRVHVAFHYGAHLFRVDHGDRARGRLGVIRDIDDDDVGNVHGRRFGRFQDLVPRADEERRDQALAPGEQGAAERVLVVGTDHGGRHRRQALAARDQHAEMIVLVDQKHRQLVVLQDDRGGGRLDLGDAFEQQRSVGFLHPGLEQRDRSLALLHAAHGNDEPVAELGATQEPKGLPAVERAGAGQERAEHRGNERAHPQEGATVSTVPSSSTSLPGMWIGLVLPDA